MKNAGRQTYMVMTFVFVLAAAGFGVMTWEDYDFLRTCRSTIGRVESVTRQPSGGGKAAGDTFVVTFSYEVGDAVYHSQQKLDEPPATGPATVYYLPKEPLKSRVELPTTYGDMLVTFACLAGVILFGRKIFKKKGRPTPPRITVTPARD